MNKINSALHEMEHVSQMAEQDQWMNRIHPLVKFLLTLMYMITVVSFDKYHLAGICSMAVYPLMIFLLGDISFGEALHRLRIVLPVVCIVGIFNPFFDREIVTYLGVPAFLGELLHLTPKDAGYVIGISGGVLSMLSLMVKGILTVLASYLLIVTTTIDKICYAMRMLHIPRAIVTQIMLIYRYVTVLLRETGRVIQAYELRSPGQKGIRIDAWGSLVGMLLLRSMDRADDVYASMCLRGFHGEFPAGAKIRMRGSDLVFLAVWAALFVLFRIFPVFQMVGQIFVSRG